MSAGLSFENVACLRGHRLLFEGLSFALPPGGAGVVTGANGAGKSSLLRIAAGLLRASAGEVRAIGRIVFAPADSAALDARLPLARALGFWAALDGSGPAGVAAALDAMGIAALAQVPVRLLSTGQRRRAALARVIAARAEVWLLDEPGNGLDAVALGRLGAAMAAHRARGGIVLAATHQPLDLADSVGIAL